MNDNRKSFVLTQSGTIRINQTYDYDSMNRLTKVYDSGVLHASYTYDKNGNRESLTYNTNSIVTTYTYNDANLVTAMYNKKGGAVLSSYSYTYYLDGNQESKTDDKGRKTVYVYNDLGQLTQEKETSVAQGTLTKDYEYDKTGNRAKMIVSGRENDMTAYTYDANNRLTKEVKNTGGGSEINYYCYDANGNQLSRLKEVNKPKSLSEKQSFRIYVIGDDPLTGTEEEPVYVTNEFDVFNRLVKTVSDHAVAEYRYRADGLRDSKTVNGEKTIHIWDGGNIVLELNANNSIIDKYIRGMNLIRSERNGFYIYNARSDVVQLTDADGNIVRSYIYDAFGVEVDKTASDRNPFRYCGEYYSMELNSYYLRNRYYNPQTGRFTQEDPIRAGLNCYTYANNNPLAFTDPLGLDVILVNKTIDWGNGLTPIDHMSAFFQDENNEWWFFFYGEDVKYRKVELDSIFKSYDDIFKNIDTINDYLRGHDLYDIQSYNGGWEVNYHSSVYVKGDFTSSHETASKLLSMYKEQLKTWDGKGLSTQNYDFFKNNCTQITMALFFQGTLPSGENVGNYVDTRGHGVNVMPNINMGNMQSIFYNKATNLAGFEAAMQVQRKKYEGKNAFTQWRHGDLKSYIDLIK